MFGVGCDFDHGRGVSESKEMARLWYEKSAEQGNPLAQGMLGLMHEYGEGGLPVSKEKARVWYEKSAEQGYPNAQYNLGAMHANGEGGLPRSKEHAFFWLTRAGEQEFEQATPCLDAMKSHCFSCGKTGKMKRCPRCKCAYYCSRECQTVAWKCDHKAACKQIRRKKQSAN